MKKLKKKGTFDAINVGMLGFIGFVLVTLLVILLISTMLKTDVVRGDGFNISDKSTWSAAYNGTLDLQQAGNLPPQFAQIIVIVIIIVGILGMLAFIGYAGYKSFNR